MILIPDIHIGTKHAQSILALLEDIFVKHNDKEVLFLGDYVYMFSYDRSVLLKLFELFVKLYQQGRNVKVMAGNHDRIGGHFVFEEGKQAFDILHSLNQQTGGTIQFLTQPYHWTEDRTLHVVIPYNDQLAEPTISDYYHPEAMFGTSLYDVAQTIKRLAESSRLGEQLSSIVNQIMLTYYETNKDMFDRIVYYVHYYTEGAQFPGVKGRFTFQDGAICSEFYGTDNVYMISGHIHEPFSYKNYLCCGSLRHTSSNEIDECKYYFTGNVEQGFVAHMIHMNPKISIHMKDDTVSIADIEQKAEELIDQSLGNIKGILVADIIPQTLDLARCELIIHADSVVGKEIHSQEFVNMVGSYKVVKEVMMNDQLFTSAIKSDFRSSFADRKQLLSEYLTHKYPEQHDAYIDFMKANGIV